MMTCHYYRCSSVRTSCMRHCATRKQKWFCNTWKTDTHRHERSLINPCEAYSYSSCFMTKLNIMWRKFCSPISVPDLPQWSVTETIRLHVCHMLVTWSSRGVSARQVRAWLVGTRKRRSKKRRTSGNEVTARSPCLSTQGSQATILSGLEAPPRTQRKTTTCSMKVKRWARIQEVP